MIPFLLSNTQRFLWGKNGGKLLTHFFYYAIMKWRKEYKNLKNDGKHVLFSIKEVGKCMKQH